MDGTCNREVFMHLKQRCRIHTNIPPWKGTKPFLDYCIFAIPLGSGKGLDQEAKTDWYLFKK